MANIQALLDTIEKIEHQFHHHGMWQNPYIPPPKIQILRDWDPDTRGAAEVLNRIFYVRSMPECARLFGPVRESAVEAFQYDYPTASERVNYARNLLNLLISDIAMLPRLDLSDISRVQE